MIFHLTLCINSITLTWVNIVNDKICHIYCTSHFFPATFQVLNKSPVWVTSATISFMQMASERTNATYYHDPILPVSRINLCNWHACIYIWGWAYLRCSVHTCTCTQTLQMRSPENKSSRKAFLQHSSKECFTIIWQNLWLLIGPQNFSLLLLRDEVYRSWHGGSCLQSQHSGCWNKKIVNSRPSWAT
jgi:hypothetical protein